jgi:CelD/BcsL family acetyltransferase involved in cellulose biosynthesis
MRVRRIDPIADPLWMGLLERSPNAHAFHHPRWLELLRDQYGYGFHACCVEDESGLAAGLPVARIDSRLTGRRHVALPFSDHCPPVVRQRAEAAALDALGRVLADERRSTGLDLEVHGEFAEIPGSVVQERFYVHQLPLSSDVSQVEAGFSKSQVRRGINKARREGLVAHRRTDATALDAFFRLHVQTRKRLGVPTQPRRFILRFEKLFDEGLGFVELIELDGRPVAAAVFLTFNGTVTYKYGASDPEHLQKRPNNLLFMEAIRDGCENGYDTLDFGRTDPDNEGLRSFKRAWGAVETPLSYTFLADKVPSPAPSRRNAIMAKVITHSPAAVGRGIGQMLYRHFG